ncbi:MAG: hypothetical protein ACLFVP_04465 [Candidatus Bathyarchaeia archaeon]
MSLEAFPSYTNSDKLRKLERALYAIIIASLLLIFIRSVYNRYNQFPWFNLPLGWDSINYVRCAKQAHVTGFLEYLLSDSRYVVYLLPHILLDRFFDPSQIEIVLPVVLLSLYSLISFLIVFKASNSLLLATSSIFLTLFNIRGSKLLGLFHANLLALVFLLCFIYALSRRGNSFGGYRDYLLITFFFLVPLTHPFTSVFFMGTLPIILVYNHRSVRGELANVGNRIKHLLLSAIYVALLLLLNFDQMFYMGSRAVSDSVYAVPGTWISMVGVEDYLFIFNEDVLSLVIIVVCNLYLVVRSRDEPWLSYLSGFSLASLLFPLVQLLVPLYIPPKRITLLNQYQVMVPLTLYGLQEDLGKVRLRLGLTGHELRLTPAAKVLSVIVLAYLAWTSWSIYDLALENDMIPWIKEDQYQGLAAVAEYRGSHPECDLIITYNPDSPGYFRIHRAYAYVLLGDTHFYIGRAEDAIHLTPPEELDYLSQGDYERARAYYYGGANPLSESRNSQYTLALIRGFALNSDIKGEAIGDNASIIKIGGTETQNP